MSHPLLDHPDNEDLRRVYWNNPIVWHTLRNGGTLEDCIVALSDVNRSLQDKICHMEALMPRKVRFDDGKIYVYRCPDHLLPDPPPLNSLEEFS